MHLHSWVFEKLSSTVWSRCQRRPAGGAGSRVTWGGAAGGTGGTQELVLYFKACFCFLVFCFCRLMKRHQELMFFQQSAPISEPLLYFPAPLHQSVARQFKKKEPKRRKPEQSLRCWCGKTPSCPLCRCCAHSWPWLPSRLPSPRPPVLPLEWRQARCRTRRPRRSSRSLSCWGWRRRSGPGSCPCTPGWTRAGTTAGTAETCPADADPPAGGRPRSGIIAS